MEGEREKEREQQIGSEKSDGETDDTWTERGERQKEGRAKEGEATQQT